MKGLSPCCVPYSSRLYQCLRPEPSKLPPSKSGWTELDVIHTDLEGVEATAYAIADNRSAELAEWDNAGLARLLEELRTEDALSGVGFEDGEIDELLDGLIDESLDLEEAPVPEPPENPTTRKGDLWILGKHRLLCGDSASVEDVDRLLAGAPIHPVNTDPPYNVKVEPRSNNAIAAGLSSFTSTHHQGLDLARHPGKAKPTGKMRAKDRPLANDFLPDDEFAVLLRKLTRSIIIATRPSSKTKPVKQPTSTTS